MKVCTDSCLFGAWIADKIEKNHIKAKNILDIGTGSGLLSLMLAQKSAAQIHAIDIDQDSFKQSAENFEASPWHNRIKGFHSDINEWIAPHNYDLIISNPPFYENDLLPANGGRSVSKHSTFLLLEDLLIKVNGLLSEDGYFAVLLPWQRVEWFEKMAAGYSLFVKEKMNVGQTSNHAYFRGMLLLQTKVATAISGGLTIKNSNNQYSVEFVELLKDYYLHL